MNIENVITNEELERRYNSLLESNWKIKKMEVTLSGNAKNKIDTWFKASRPMLLNLLEITENKDYPFVYHDKY